MDVSVAQQTVVAYKSPPRVQVWFLSRSRRRWKQKYMQLKGERKRMQNRVADVTHSRAGWREEAERQQRRAEALAAENAQLKDQLERQKKIRAGRGNVGV